METREQSENQTTTSKPRTVSSRKSNTGLLFGLGITMVIISMLLISLPEDSTKEVQKVTPAVAKRVEKPSGLPTYGCGENVHIVAPVGRWSRGAPQRSGCDFYFLRDPLLDGSASDRRKNWHGLLTVRINGKGGPEMHSGRLPDGRLVSAYFEELVDTMAFRSEENYPVYIILKYLPK